MDKAALDAAYNNAIAVKNSAQIVEDWTKRTAALRARFSSTLDIPYGKAERNRVDLFAPKAGAPLLAFIHGGWWQNRAKDNFGFIAEGPLAQGINVAMIGYTLAPNIRLTGIVAEIDSALTFLAKTNKAIVVSGWSAGGHLTAMAMGHPGVKAGLSISGAYDLEPIRLSYVNDKLKLDEDEARRMSPMLLPRPQKPLTIAYGGNELPEMRRQSEDYGKTIGRPAYSLAGHDHFTILEELASPTGALTRMVLDLAPNR
ncbi:MAG: alpha/beta hydrolase [Clostridia bacterium]